MPDLGTKWECTSCNTKFYDLGKDEPVCPKCGLNQLAEEVEEPEPAAEEEEASEAAAEEEPEKAPEAEAKKAADEQAPAKAEEEAGDEKPDK